MKVVVTGASEGIGGAVALEFSRMASVRREHLEIVLTTSGTKPAPSGLIEQIQSEGGRVLHLEGDLADQGICLDLARQALEFLGGGMDAFISNAGASSGARLKDMSPEMWDWMFNVNVRPTFLLAQAFHSALASRQGSIVAVSSMSGQRPHPGLGAYSSAKAALIMLCRVLAQEWASEGIRVNAVAPGMIRTPLTEKIYAHEETKRGRETIVPLARIGAPQDVAAAVAFLASPAASYITGEVLRADGGLCDRTLGAIPGLPASG